MSNEQFDIDINIDHTFNDVYFPHLYRDTPLQIYYGGAGSGKSCFIAQKQVITCLTEGRNWLVLRQEANKLRGSIYNEVCAVIRAWGLQRFFTVLDGRMEITCNNNGSQIIFQGLDDTEKVKSIRPKKGVFEAIHIEEATQVSSSVYKDLQWRLRGVTELKKYVVLSFNPIYRQHWIAKDIFNGRSPDAGKEILLNNGRCFILRTNYTHNKFLPPDDIERIEEMRGDAYRWPVYGLGEWGTMGSVLFSNWSVEDLSGFDGGGWRNGLDFGWHPDPAAFVHTAKKGKRIYIPQGLYLYKLTNPQLAAEIKPICGNDIVWCDSAEPKSIAEIQRDKDNPIRALPVKKGKDSVWHGIQWLQQHEIVIDQRLQWLINEFSTYKLQEDKNGDSIPKKPVDAWNHGIDALRYAWESAMVDNSPIMYIPKGTTSVKDIREGSVFFN
jgi:phage terminase large subunit